MRNNGFKLFLVLICKLILDSYITEYCIHLTSLKANQAGSSDVET